LWGVDIDPDIYLYTVFHENGFLSNNTDIVMEHILTDELSEDHDWHFERCDLERQCGKQYGWSPKWKATFHHRKIHLDKLNADGIPEDSYDLNN